MSSTQTSEFQRHGLIPKMQTERPTDDMDVVAEIHLRLRRNGAMSIEGNVGDKSFALHLLENAIDAVKRQIPDSGIVIPGGDVDAPEFKPLVPLR